MNDQFEAIVELVRQGNYEEAKKRYTTLAGDVLNETAIDSAIESLKKRFDPGKKKRRKNERSTVKE